MIHITYLLYDVFLLAVIVVTYTITHRYSLPRFLPALRASILTSIPFILLDILVTNHWWMFAGDKTLGIIFFHLPIEEYFFYLVTPLLCLLLAAIATHIISYKKISPITTLLAAGISLLFSVISLHAGKSYSGIIFLTLCLFYTYDAVQQNPISRTTLYWAYVALIILTTSLFDNYLTTLHILTYNSHAIWGVHIGSVPIEDILFGIAFGSTTLMMYHTILKSHDETHHL